MAGFYLVPLGIRERPQFGFPEANILVLMLSRWYVRSTGDSPSLRCSVECIGTCAMHMPGKSSPPPVQRMRRSSWPMSKWPRPSNKPLLSNLAPLHFAPQRWFPLGHPMDTPKCSVGEWILEHLCRTGWGTGGRNEGSGWDFYYGVGRGGVGWVGQCISLIKYRMKSLVCFYTKGARNVDNTEWRVGQWPWAQSRS